MNVVNVTEYFKRRAKRLLKKYLSLSQELEDLIIILENNPQTGTSLGDNLYKIRLANESKGKGKSGGFRIITYLVIPNDEDLEINLITIYDKSEQADIPKAELKKMITEIFAE